MTSNTHEEIVGLDVSVDKVFRMDVLDAAYHLVGQHQHRLHREATRTKVKQVFQRRPQQVHDQHIIVPLLAVPPAFHSNQ